MSMQQTSRVRRLQQQQGAVLIVALVLLLVLTVLGTAGIQDTVLSERMAGNFRDSALAFEAAERELRRWETDLNGVICEDYDVAWPVSIVTESTISVDPLDYANYSAVAYGSTTLQVAFSDVPLVYLECIERPDSQGTLVSGGLPTRFETTRITVRGFGQTPNSDSILQSTLRAW